MDVYENIFEVTETLQNGKERRIKKSVYTPIFREWGGRRVHITTEERIKAGKAELKARHYYNIDYLTTKKRDIIYAEI